MKKIFALFTAVAFASTAAFSNTPLKAGDKALDFNLKNVKGDYVSLSGMNDAKGFIVVFTSNVCPVVKAYDDRIAALHEKFGPKGYPVIAINSNDAGVAPGDSYEEMKKTAVAKGYGFEYLRDEDQKIARHYGATNTPHVYVLSRDGDNLQVEYTGAIDNNADDKSKADKKYVEDAVSALLSGGDVTVRGTKAVGCSMKWKKAE
ncbi:MAG TPA: thioredoxin family protein [Bacteroidales bacterium]|jgi:peroxiredoxin|nr:thioredoxin family protein [Bacteroidales bacterium]